MIRNVLLSLLALTVLVLTVPAAAQPDQAWPQNGYTYTCNYTWPDGSGGTSVIQFRKMWATSHKFGDGNELKRGEMATWIPNIGQDPDGPSEQPIDVAYKPFELPSPYDGIRFELTVPQNGIQCKNFVNEDIAFPYGPLYHFRLKFSQCSNGIVQTCQICDDGAGPHWPDDCP